MKMRSVPCPVIAAALTTPITCSELANPSSSWTALWAPAYDLHVVPDAQVGDHDDADVPREDWHRAVRQLLSCRRPLGESAGITQNGPAAVICDTSPMYVRRVVLRAAAFTRPPSHLERVGGEAFGGAVIA